MYMQNTKRLEINHDYGIGIQLRIHNFKCAQHIKFLCEIFLKEKIVSSETWVNSKFTSNMYPLFIIEAIHDKYKKNKFY